MSKKSEIDRLKEELEALEVKQAEIREKLEAQRREAAQPVEAAVRKVAEAVAEVQRLLRNDGSFLTNDINGDLEDLEISTPLNRYTIINGRVSVEKIDEDEWQASNC